MFPSYYTLTGIVTPLVTLKLLTFVKKVKLYCDELVKLYVAPKGFLKKFLEWQEEKNSQPLILVCQCSIKCSFFEQIRQLKLQLLILNISSIDTFLPKN